MNSKEIKFDMIDRLKLGWVYFSVLIFCTVIMITFENIILKIVFFFIIIFISYCVISNFSKLVFGEEE